jgi:yecA family protein
MAKISRLSAEEREELESLMEICNPEGPLADSAPRLHGFFTSVASGPLILPSEWLPLVFGSPDVQAWESADQSERANDLVMRFYNEVCADLGDRSGRFHILIDRFEGAGEPLDWPLTGARVT